MEGHFSSRHPGLVPGSTQPQRLVWSLLSDPCLSVDPGTRPG